MELKEQGGHVGIKIPNWGPLATTDAIGDAAASAEKCGFDSVWVSDHVVLPMELDGEPPFTPDTPFLDPFVALAFAAARTRRVQLGIGVLVLPIRHPVLVAKQAASLDVLSQGRLVLGIGAGWQRGEFELLGQDFASRGHRADHAMSTMRACWSGSRFDLDGRPAAMAPTPKRIPIVVGGHSSAALARAARLGDGWYGSGLTPVEFEPLAKEVRRLRGPSPFTVGVKAPTGLPDDPAGLEREYRAAGADFVVFDVDVDAFTSLADRLDLANRNRKDGSGLI